VLLLDLASKHYSQNAWTLRYPYARTWTFGKRMITYFNLRAPTSEQLLADNESYGNRQNFPCSITTEHLDGSRRIGQLLASVKHNRHDERMIWCWAFGFLTHESLLAEFAQQRFTGYRSQPATLRFRDGSISREYHEFIVTGWAGLAAKESGVRVVKGCPACHWKKYSPVTNYEELIDWTQWTGEDFFIVWPMPNWILITERVALWLLSRDVRSFRLTSLDDWDQAAGATGFTVGRLSNFLPEDLAIKYGRSLGLE
jgi:hypothetical protein